MAAADDRPLTDLTPHGGRSTRSGYWYRAIRHADEVPGAPDPNRFAFFAFPDPSCAARYCFVIDEHNTIFRAIAEGRRELEVFPTEAELRTSWSKLD